MSDTPCIIVNMTGAWSTDNPAERLGPILSENRRPKYVHDDLESAEKEALRLHKLYGGPCGRFVIFQAVQTTATRTPFEIAASPVITLEPYGPPVPFTIPERARKPRKKGKP